MATLDPQVTVEAVQRFVQRETEKASEHHRKEKDEENRAYLSGQLDLLERLEAFITV